LGNDLSKIIAQNITRRLTKISSLENKIEMYIKRADSGDQIFEKILEKTKSIEDFIFIYVSKPISIPNRSAIELEDVVVQHIRRI